MNITTKEKKKWCAKCTALSSTFATWIVSKKKSLIDYISICVPISIYDYDYCGKRWWTEMRDYAAKKIIRFGICWVMLIYLFQNKRCLWNLHGWYKIPNKVMLMTRSRNESWDAVVHKNWLLVDGLIDWLIDRLIKFLSLPFQSIGTFCSDS